MRHDGLQGLLAVGVEDVGEAAGPSGFQSLKLVHRQRGEGWEGDVKLVAYSGDLGKGGKRNVVLGKFRAPKNQGPS